ncbi:MAG: hypothetical protein NXI24_18865 [bacterium]|nr:hypothetical protein [bacterium]
MAYSADSSGNVPGPEDSANDEAEARAFEEFLADLNARINPERSRAFDRRRLEASRETMFALSRELWPRARGERISIVGSNGKGSTAWYLAAIAEARTGHRGQADVSPESEQASAQARVGLYTSPHLTSPLERIRLDRTPINARDAVAGLEHLQTMLPDYASFSYFEIFTLLAWHLFQSRDCPVQIFEAGLGGRFDATRIARADTVVLTRIDLEHTQILGETPQAILTEKLGIVSPECRRVFYGPQSALGADEIEAEIRRLAPEAKICAWRPDAAFEDYLAENLAYARFIFDTTGTSASRATAESSGPAPVDLAPIAPPPGRLERRELPARLLPGQHGHRSPRDDDDDARAATAIAYFDVAHNPASIQRSLRDLTARPDFPGLAACELRLGVLKDRDPVECLAAAREIGFHRARLLTGGDLAAWPADFAARLPEDFDAAPESTDAAAGRAPSPPPADVRCVVVLGSHRIYNYFVELTAGGEKTDPDL